MSAVMPVIPGGVRTATSPSTLALGRSRSSTRLIEQSTPTVGSWAGRRDGYNYQVNSLVFGLEADASWTSLKGSGSFNTIPGDVNWAIQNQLDWFGTVRGRVGVAVNNFLFYGTGGVAFG